MSLCHVLEWLDKEFLPENRCRLKAAHSYLTGELQSMGIPYLQRPAALYVWADLRKVRSSKSPEDVGGRIFRFKLVLHYIKCKSLSCIERAVSMATVRHVCFLFFPLVPQRVVV